MSEPVWRALARSVVAAAFSDGAPDDLEALFARLAAVGAELVGSDAYAALASRALHLEREPLPELAALSLACSLPLDGWALVTERLGAAQTKALAAALIERIACLLAQFLGDELTLSLLRRACPELPLEHGCTS